MRYEYIYLIYALLRTEIERNKMIYIIKAKYIFITFIKFYIFLAQIDCKKTVNKIHMDITNNIILKSEHKYNTTSDGTECFNLGIKI